MLCTLCLQGHMLSTSPIWKPLRCCLEIVRYYLPSPVALLSDCPVMQIISLILKYQRGINGLRLFSWRTFTFKRGPLEILSKETRTVEYQVPLWAVD